MSRIKQFHSIGDAVKHLHWRHGRGDLTAYHINADGRLDVTTQPFGMKPEMRKGRVDYLSDYAPFGRVRITLHGHRMVCSIIG